MNHIGAVRSAYRLWRTQSRVDTVIAVVLVVAFVGYPLLRFWWASRSGGDT